MVFSFLMEAAVFPTDSQNVDLMAAIMHIYWLNVPDLDH